MPPLSREEQRTLDEIERALQVDDPRLAAPVSLEHLRYHRVILASIAFIAALVLNAGLIATQAQFAIGVIVSVTGFLAMVAAIGWLFRHPSAGDAQSEPGNPAGWKRGLRALGRGAWLLQL